MAALCGVGFTRSQMRAFMADAFAGLEGHDPEAEALAAVRNATPRFSPPPSKAEPASPGPARQHKRWFGG